MTGPADTRSDEALVRLVRDGDQGAFRELSERYERRFRAYITSRLAPGMRRRVAASDILQEAHLVALQRSGEFEDRGEGSFGRWFATIVDLKIRNAIQKHVAAERRSIAAEITRSGRGPTGMFRAREPSPSKVAAGNELRAALSDAIDALPADSREVLALVQGERLTMDVAAARMGRTPAAVKKLYGRARARLEALVPGGGLGRGGRRRPTR